MNRCEALVKLPLITDRERYVPCGKADAELHHKVTRARGGVLLDVAGETYHQLYLCREHHMVAHDEGQAFESGLLIAGSVITDADGKPLYTGPDEYLTKMYGPRE